jgi:tetratricopeptide (TPR) repeat protein
VQTPWRPELAAGGGSGKLASLRGLGPGAGFHQTARAMDDHTKQLLLLGREHYEKREFDKAEYLLRQVVAKTDRYADVYDMLGVIAHGRGDFVQAERYFEKAVQLNPNYTEAQLNLMVTYNDLGKYDQARKLYATIRSRGGDKGAKSDPFAKGKIANMHAETSQAYQDAGMLVEAIVELEKAVALCPQFADLRTRLAVLVRDSGDVVRARAEFEAAKNANPRYLQARVLLGVLLLSLAENEAAIREFQEVLEMDPENKSAQTYLRLARGQSERGGSGAAPQS